MATLLANPFAYFFDRCGRPLDAGFIYVGEANKDPKDNPVDVYFDKALTIPAVQPIRTLAGLIVDDSAPSSIYTSETDFSVRVLDKNGNQVLYIKSYYDQMTPLGLGDDLVTVKQPYAGAITSTQHVKNAENLSVSDFKDNSKTWTQAFQAAAATGQKVFVPAGSYNLTADVTGKFYSHDIVTFTGNYAATVLNLRESQFSALHYLCASMAAGNSIKIACYGDSTTDGDTTTDFTPNPVDVDGNAIGNSDHAATAPNAWPAKLQALLRDMFGNTAINVFNAGYSGQRMDTGWAFQNYDAAITHNSFYGKPDICFIGFGLNDISGSGSQITAHAQQTRKLVQKLLNTGTLPILLSCNAVARGAENARSGAEASRQLDEVKRSIATEYRIPFFDIGLDQKNWLERNNDARRWTDLQPDALHFGDIGHAFMAGAVARYLFRDTVIFNGTNQIVPTQDSRSNRMGSHSDLFKFVNNRAGANQRIDAGAATAGQSLFKYWVWNESPRCELVYRGIFNESYVQASLGTTPRIRVTDKINDAFSVFVPSGIGNWMEGWRMSDKPYRIGLLPYGLSCVEYVMSDSPLQTFYGHIELLKTIEGSKERSNCLEHTSELVVNIPANTTSARLLPEYADGSNMYGCAYNEYVDFYIEATLAPYSGIVLGCNNAYVTDSQLESGAKNFVYLYRSDGSTPKMYIGRCGYYPSTDSSPAYNVMGDINFDLSPANKRFIVRFQRLSYDTIRVMVWDGWDKNITSPAIFDALVTTTYMIPLAGFAGGIFWESNAASRTSTIHKLIKVQGLL